MSGAQYEPVMPPPGLREQVLATSLAARPPGRPVPEVPAISPAEAFRRVADAFYQLLSSLDEREWRLHVLRDLDVQGLVGHLIGVEEDMQRAMSGDPAVAQADHVTSTQPAAGRQAGRPAAETRADWRRAAGRTLELAQGDLAAEVALHGVQLPLAALLVGRAFEMWTHENDIRLVTGRPPSVPDPSALRMMTELATAMLPLVAIMTGLREPISLRLVLTGRGGGTWDIAIGEDVPEPTAMAIVTDVVGFCRLAANRLRPADLELHVTGDRDRAQRVLTAASAMGLD
jgi:uncharacterized protein (TIGR03083 family)